MKTQPWGDKYGMYSKAVLKMNVFKSGNACCLRGLRWYLLFL